MKKQRGPRSRFTEAYESKLRMRDSDEEEEVGGGPNI